MTRAHVEKLEWFSLTSEDGTEYVRMAAGNWGQWMGESLEIVQCAEENALLEALFQSLNATLLPP